MSEERFVFRIEGPHGSLHGSLDADLADEVMRGMLSHFKPSTPVAPQEQGSEGAQAPERRVTRQRRKGGHYVVCAQCEKRFVGYRRNARFCSEKCRLKFYADLRVERHRQQRALEGHEEMPSQTSMCDSDGAEEMADGCTLCGKQHPPEVECAPGGVTLVAGQGPRT